VLARSTRASPSCAAADSSGLPGATPSAREGHDRGAPGSLHQGISALSGDELVKAGGMGGSSGEPGVELREEIDKRA
jgi:hypothetical protein